MTGKKKSTVTMGIDSFLGDDADDWAAATDDDFDEPVQQSNDYGRSSDRYERNESNERNERDYDDAGRRSYDRPRRNYDDRPELPIPNEPPYVAHIGNLSFRATEADLIDLFSAQVTVENAQIITDRNTGRSKGFGFVTFATREDLEVALGASNVASLMDRTITVKVSAGPKEGGFRGAKEPSRADSVDKWERGRGAPKAEKEREPRRYGNRDDREGRGFDRGFDRDRPRRNYEQPRERKQITIQPRTSDEPIGAPAKSNKSNPFGDAKPRDELAFQKKKRGRKSSKSSTKARGNYKKPKFLIV